MIYSMTGFAAVTIELPQGSLSLDLRSVNHRYLEIQFRLSDDFRMLESNMREAIAKQLTRGKVECRLNFSEREAGNKPLEINTDLLLQLGLLNKKVQEQLPDSQSLRVLDILKWPGILGQNTLAAESLRDECLPLLQRALDELRATREREGEKLKALLLERVEQIEALIIEVAPKIPTLLRNHQEKLATRLKEVMGNGDDDRIRQELALFAQKIDVDEELSRLKTHLSEVKRVLHAGGSTGKRLDFLMQELNREANTLGAKSVASEVSQTSMELKVLIEQMREQIQNIE
ncbi:YicC/YloC family endoribonuclease [Sulfurirhabdus autotrophica]|uniref:Uncharacterized protein (TIGR00255 family) n=1 Tax=Sulfurirhabdus autotrophica TaxID=1706046 RepID=A0A4R3XYH2_9PROT|nr:YicC/YloC family endoribonuclease [Sulfurirhabdus autotrophica]TCV84117.1 uncharacterized protein (TIGR00255 family) [Sulfurirhabdus autotrophica]